MELGHDHHGVGDAPTNLAPNGSQVGTSPVFSWRTPNAPPYRLTVGNPGVEVSFGAIDAVYPDSSFCVPVPASGSLRACSIAPGIALTPGATYSWTVQNAYGSSTSANFAVAGSTVPSPPVPVSPADGAITGSLSTYTWAASGGATSYYLLVQKTAGVAIGASYNATDIGCGAGTGSCSVTPATALADGGSYAWFVNATNSAGTSAWSDGHMLTVSVGGATSIPGIPVPRAPFGLVPSTISHDWNAVAGATEYDLLVQNTLGVAGQLTVQAQGACGAITLDCQVASSFPLTAGVAYNWFVRARNAIGTSAWSVAMPITYAIGPPPAPLSPQGAVTATPTFSWSAVSGASKYRVLVQNMAAVWGSMDVDPVLANCASTCTIAANFALPSATNFSWFVKVWTPAGESAWGGPLPIHTP